MGVWRSICLSSSSSRLFGSTLVLLGLAPAVQACSAESTDELGTKAQQIAGGDAINVTFSTALPEAAVGALSRQPPGNIGFGGFCTGTAIKRDYLTFDRQALEDTKSTG
jgi:hypothetical protein